MTLRSNARTFPVAFPAAHAGAVWETDGERLPVGFLIAVESPDVFAATGTVTAPGASTAGEPFGAWLFLFPKAA